MRPARAGSLADAGTEAVKIPSRSPRGCRCGTARAHRPDAGHRPEADRRPGASAGHLGPVRGPRQRTTTPSRPPAPRLCDIHRFFRYPRAAAPSASPATRFRAQARQKGYVPHHLQARCFAPAIRRKSPPPPVPASRPWPTPAPSAAWAGGNARRGRQVRGNAREHSRGRDCARCRHYRSGRAGGRARHPDCGWCSCSAIVPVSGLRQPFPLPY